MHIVSLINPSPSGAYQVHMNLMRGLASRGWTMSWLCSGSFQAAINRAGGYEVSPGDLVAEDTLDMTVRTKALGDRLREISPDAILCHAIGDKVDFNAIRYFPQSIPKILVLHNTTVAHYRACRAVRAYLSATVAISPRIEQDLISSYGFDNHRVRFIPNGIDLSAFQNAPARKRTTDRLRILVHSRINHAQKGVFWIPEILQQLDRETRKWECTISGDGKELPELRQRLTRKGFGERIAFLGWTAPDDVPSLMSKHDVLLFPSKYEGYPLALVEAMASSCVPVASRLPGITDSIIQDRINGLLFSIGDVRSAAKHLSELAANPDRLASYSDAAQKAASKNGLKAMCDQYSDLICEVLNCPVQTPPAEDIDHCALADDLRPAWWNRLPEPFKNSLRVVRENVRTLVRVP